jgi:hypothetical protein
MPGVYTNGLPTVAPGIPAAGSYNALTGYELIACDTERASGAPPQSVAVSAFQIAAMAALMSVNTATSTAAAATLNTLMGRCVTEALTTAAAATYSFTLTNSTIVAASVMQVAVYSLTNTTPGLVVQSVTPAAGSAVIVIRNAGTAALNGTILIVFQVAAD